MMFSAAYSARFEEARRQSQVQERPQLLWRRGFHSEGGRAGWGYYLEPAPVEEPPVDERLEREEGRVEEVEDGEHEQANGWANGHEDRIGHVGELKRSSPSERSGYPASWARVIASHGAYFPSCPSPLALRPHPQPPPRSTNSSGDSKASRHGKQDLRNCVALVRYSLPFAWCYMPRLDATRHGSLLFQVRVDHSGHILGCRILFLPVSARLA